MLQIFLKDIFEASVMVDVKYLVLAVRTFYNGHEDYKKITDWLVNESLKTIVAFLFSGLP